MLKYNCEHDCCQKKYFRTQEKIKIKSEIVVKRDRNTNLVPAKTGILTRRGWCPRTGKEQQLMVKEAVSE